MESHEADAFAELIEVLGATFGTQVDEAAILGYWAALEDLSLDDVRSGVARAMREGQHMPRPVEIRRGSGEVAPADRAVQAFGDVSAAIRRCGHRASVDFADKTINATLRLLGGWMRVCTMPSDDWLVWGRKDFLATYAALVNARLSAEAVAHLPGLDEAENAGKFPDRVPKPVLVGEPRAQVEAPQIKLLGGGR
jgi:hypothetical protein